jgi:hypothetical protein
MKNRFIGFLFWFVVPMSFATSQNTAREKQPKLEKNLPAVYITFECAGSREPRREGESDKGVWLRLHNNLRWALTVPGFNPTVPGFTVPTTLATKSRADEVVLYYEVEDTRMRRGRTLLREVSEKNDGAVAGQGQRIPPPPIGYRMTDLVKTIPLTSGDSVLFSIPSEHLTGDLAVSLSFQFQWEGSMDETEHRVYFYGSDVPVKEVRQCR